MRQTHIKKWTLKCLGLITLLLLAGCVPAIGAQDTPPTPAADQLLPLPSTMTLEDYEPLLFDFLESKQYQELDWAYDKRVRDTGPYIDGVSYGTHPAVRIYYSPEVYDWLKNGRVGDLPDGAMIIKEMFPTPAARYANLSGDEITAAAQRTAGFGAITVRVTAWMAMSIPSTTRMPGSANTACVAMPRPKMCSPSPHCAISPVRRAVPFLTASTIPGCRRKTKLTTPAGPTKTWPRNPTPRPWPQASRAAISTLNS
jgi:hypothetical protein